MTRQAQAVIYSRMDEGVECLQVVMETTRDFSVEMGSGMETHLVAKKGQSAFWWESRGL